jgi:RNA polymerase sigma factor (sigma-70 family)
MQRNQDMRMDQKSRWSGWMLAAQQGDSIAYRALLVEMQPWLARFFARRLAWSVADDLAQETLLAVHAKRHTYDPALSFMSWVAAIAHYKWVDWVRKQKIRGEIELPEIIPVEAQDSAVHARLNIDRLLAALPPRQAEAIRLVKLEGRSVDEASSASGQSVSLIKVNIHRGMQRMTKIMEAATPQEILESSET